MYVCKICKREFKKYFGLSAHIRQLHMKLKDYYDQFLKKNVNEDICALPGCNNKTSFMNLNLGYRKFCCRTCSNRSKDSQNKAKETCMKKYKVPHIMKLKKYRDNLSQTILELYEDPERSKITKQKYEETCLRKYNCKSSNQAQIVKDRKKKSFDILYNDPEKMQAIQTKREQTSLKNFGVTHHSKSPIMIQKMLDTYYKNNWLPKLKILLDHLKMKLIDKKYQHAHYFHNWECTTCGYKFNQSWNEIQQGYTCPKCYPRDNTSKAEREICEFINTISHYEIILNSRSIISPKELDIYIPDKQIGIEHDGLYWHNEENLNNPQSYHLIKTEICEKQGIRLIHIFEDEWIFKQDIVKARLKQILGVDNSERIHARKCEIKEIDPKTKNEFLEKYHIQGKDASVIKLGAFYNDELVSVMTFGHGNISKGSKAKKGVWELNRFCSNSNYHISGIASKLLEHFKRNFDWQEIFSYADKRWSNGNLYYKLGFTLKHTSRPNYWYIKDGQRIHRFGLRKQPDEPKDIPEWVLRQREGYSRIWDCGNLKFQLQKN